MERLELKHIQHYPIGTLKVVCPDNSLATIVGITTNDIFIEVGTDAELDPVLVRVMYDDGENKPKYDFATWGISQIKLILHPMTDLYEEIDGEIGIAKLIHIASGADTSDIAKSEIIKTIDGYRVVYKSRIDSKIYNEATLEYRHGIWKFYWNGELDSINQLELFEYLFKHHFNVYNLPEHLFVDINTIQD